MIRNRLLALAAVTSLATAGLVVGTATTAQAVNAPQLGNRTCTVSYVVNKPWWQCINPAPGSAQLPPSGCPSNPKRVVTCTG